MSNPPVSMPGPSPSKDRRFLLWLLAILAVIGVYVFGSHHVVSSSMGTKLVPKVHFTFSETFVSLDAITGMPFLQAKTQWPLAVKALQKEGLLESDDAFKSRIEQGVQEDMRKAQEDIERQMRNSGY
jgi:hypothetical protein